MHVVSRCLFVRQLVESISDIVHGEKPENIGSRASHRSPHLDCHYHWIGLIVPNISFQRILIRGGLLTAKGRRDPPPSASVRWAGLHPSYHSSPRPQVATGGGFRPLNSDR